MAYWGLSRQKQTNMLKQAWAPGEEIIIKCWKFWPKSADSASLMVLPFVIRVCFVIQGIPGGKDLTSGECSLGQTIPI